MISRVHTQKAIFNPLSKGLRKIFYSIIDKCYICSVFHQFGDTKTESEAKASSAGTRIRYEMK